MACFGILSGFFRCSVMGCFFRTVVVVLCLAELSKADSPENQIR